MSPLRPLPTSFASISLILCLLAAAEASSTAVTAAKFSSPPLAFVTSKSSHSKTSHRIGSSSFVKSNSQSSHLHLYIRSPSRTLRTSSQSYYKSPKSSPLEDEPWKSDDSYWDMLQQASKDPAEFERFVSETMAMKKEGKALKKGRCVSATAVHSTANSATSSAGFEDGDDAPKKKKPYQPVEEWDAQRNQNMSKEERVQWECQRGGDRFRQNEILRHHLNSF